MRKLVSEIKHGHRVFALLPTSFSEVCRLTGLDKHTAQKVLDDLVKHGYAWKDGDCIVIYRKMDDGKKTTH